MALSKNIIPSSLQTAENSAKPADPGQERGTSDAPDRGLVPSLTSDTLTLDPHEIRCKRLYRAVKTSARLHEEDLQASGSRYRSWFITLTYRPGVEWEPLHITQTLKAVRSWCDRQAVDFRYVWVAEVQEKRQAREGGHCLHYHLMVFLPVGLQLPKFDKRGWWPHGFTQTVRAKKPVSYMAKYASKGSNGGSFPKGARIHGCGGLSLNSRLQRAWWLCPAYIREHWPDYSVKPSRAQGGGWVAKITGEWIPAMYRIVSYNPLVVCRINTT